VFKEQLSSVADRRPELDAMIDFVRERVSHPILRGNWRSSRPKRCGSATRSKAATIGDLAGVLPRKTPRRRRDIGSRRAAFSVAASRADTSPSLLECLRSRPHRHASESGSQTHRWRKTDSNPRSLGAKQQPKPAVAVYRDRAVRNL
jgi:hypothetical protein